MTDKIEPWMKLAAEHIEDAYTVAIQQQVVGTEPAIVEVAYIIAGHAPEQELEAKEKEYAAREQRLLHQLTLAADSFDTILGEAKIASITYKRIQAILNEGVKP